MVWRLWTIEKDLRKESSSSKSAKLSLNRGTPKGKRKRGNAGYPSLALRERMEKSHHLHALLMKKKG